MSLRVNSLSYRAGEIVGLLETLAMAARNLDGEGKVSARMTGSLGDSLDLVAHLASDLFGEMEQRIGPSVNDEQPRKGKAA